MALTDFAQLDEAMDAIFDAQDAGDAARAERLFRAAWAEIPEPRKDHGVAQVLAGDFVEFLRAEGEHEKAREALAWLREAYDAAEGQNPFVDFIDACIAYDLGDTDRARALFGSLHARFGKRPFASADPKYLAFATSGN